MAPPKKTTSDLPIAKVGDVPAHLLALVSQDLPDSLATMRHHRVLNRVGVIQPSTKSDKKQKYGPEGTVVIPASETVLAGYGEEFDVTPVMFFDEFIQWGDRKDTAGKMIREKSLDLASALAVKCQDGSKWTEKYGDKQQFIAKNTHHLNFLCVVMSGDLKGTLVVLSFIRTEFKKGNAWIGAIQQRKIGGRQAPLYTSVWTMKSASRTNDKGEWFGLDFRSAAEPWVSAEDLPQLKAMHEQLVTDYKAQALEVGHETAERDTGESNPADSTEM